ncbi:MAG: 30S ribosomal protein S16 [Candidatus Shapirobacteria bacterium]|jgi:ribosomal protein S16
MLKIKLTPRGTKHHLSYRIVVSEARSKYNGNFADDLGFYTPQTKTLQVNKEKIVDWQKKGAILTVGVDKLLNPKKIPKKTKKTTKDTKAETPKVEEKVKE